MEILLLFPFSTFLCFSMMLRFRSAEPSLGCDFNTFTDCWLPHCLHNVVCMRVKLQLFFYSSLLLFSPSPFSLSIWLHFSLFTHLLLTLFLYISSQFFSSSFLLPSVPQLPICSSRRVSIWMERLSSPW